MPLYFAYGANMEAAAMAMRCPRARRLCRGRLAGWRPILMSSGFLSIAPDPRCAAHGVLWDMPPGETPALDRFEEVARGLYVKRLLPVLREPFGAARALVYVGAECGGGVAPRDYLAGVVAAARAQKLPAVYVDALARLAAAQERNRAHER